MLQITKHIKRVWFYKSFCIDNGQNLHNNVTYEAFDILIAPRSFISVVKSLLEILSDTDVTEQSHLTCEQGDNQVVTESSLSKLWSRRE